MNKYEVSIREAHSGSITVYAENEEEAKQEARETMEDCQFKGCQLEIGEAIEQPRITAKEAAIDLIEYYVKRGDSLDSLRQGGMGSYCGDYHASIGGYLNGKKYGHDKILVSKVYGNEVNEVFSLEQIYNEIKNGTQQVPMF